MIPGMIGRKIGMARMFDEKGNVIPVTLIEMGPCTVVAIKSSDGKDKYDAVQVGYSSVKLDKLTKPMRGVYQKSGLKSGFKILKEFRVDSADGLGIGDEISADAIFTENMAVKIVGTSIGRGFAGAMKRHGFHGSCASHGAEKVHRRPMSGGATDAQRVFKGKRGPGRMGNERVTVANLKLVKMKPMYEAGQSEAADAAGKAPYIIAVRGAVPGKTNSLVIVEKM
jgi:large subunit ribosomal protein L3